MDKIILYTIHCPQCNVLEKKLQQKGIQFEVVEDREYILSLGIKSAPVLEVNGERMSFTKAMAWLKNTEAR